MTRGLNLSFLPASPAELRAQGVRRPDVLLLTGDAYVDHPSFGAAVVGRLLESWGLAVALAAQPDWREPAALAAYGRPRLFTGVTAGNMDSMVNHLTAHRKRRHDDAYSPGGEHGLRPNRASVVYAQLARRVFPDGLVILGGVEASLRRFAHYDYWDDSLHRSVLLDARADLLIYGMAERALRAVVDRLSPLSEVRRPDAGRLYGIRGTAFALGSREATPRLQPLLDGEELRFGAQGWASSGPARPPAGLFRDPLETIPWRTCPLPSFESIQTNPPELARATRLVEQGANPSARRIFIQQHDTAFVVVCPPAWPLSTEELDCVHELPFTRLAHPRYSTSIPAAEMIQMSIQVTRGCFGGCTFCAISLHEGKQVQSRSQASILREIATLRQHPCYRGVISDLGGPTANLWQLGCRDPALAARCRRPSCLHPSICRSLITDHGPLRGLLTAVRCLGGVRHAFIASGVRHDLALHEPGYLEELLRYHLSGHLHVAPEHTDAEVLRLARKPRYEVFLRFRELFERLRREVGVERYLNPYFVSGLPGSTEARARELHRTLRAEGWRPRQVQSFIPTPGTVATAMYHGEVHPYRSDEHIEMPRTLADKQRQHALLTRDLPQEDRPARRPAPRR